MNDRAPFATAAAVSCVAPPADPVLPALALALDAAAMAGWLERTRILGRVHACRIERVKYRPRRSALVLYRVTGETSRGAAAEQFVYAGLYPPEEARRRHASACKALPRGAEAAAPHLAEAQSMLFWAFPQDRKLPALAVLADARRLAAEVLPGMLGRQVAACGVTPVSYFPEHAYSVRVEVAAGAAAPWRAYAKTTADGRGAATCRHMRTLRASAAYRDGRLNIARPCAYQPASATLWQEELPGRVLETVAGAAGLEQPVAFVLGASLASLHATPIAGLPRVTGAALLLRTQEAAQTLAAAMPALASPLCRLMQGLTIAFVADPDAAPATLHGDLHLNNIIVGDAGIGFIDLDDLVAGPAAAELGAFVAGLLYRQVLHGGAAAAATAVAQAFLDGYDRAGHAPPVSAAAVRWHAAAALVRERAWRCLTALKPGRVELIPALVDAAAALLSAPVAGWRPAPWN